MNKHLAYITAVTLSLGAGPALAAGEAHIEDFDFSFEGPFGAFDQNQLQRRTIPFRCRSSRARLT